MTSKDLSQAFVRGFLKAAALTNTPSLPSNVPIPAPTPKPVVPPQVQISHPKPLMYGGQSWNPGSAGPLFGDFSRADHNISTNAPGPMTNAVNQTTLPTPLVR